MSKRATDIVAYLTWVGLIIALVAGNRQASRFHLNQSLVIWIAGTICGILGHVALVGWIISAVGGLFCGVCWFIGIINAMQGVEKEVPLLGQFHLL